MKRAELKEAADEAQVDLEDAVDAAHGVEDDRVREAHAKLLAACRELDEHDAQDR